LVDGDDFDEPISDTARGTLDGHIVLSRELSERAHYPAIDMQHSISRLQNRITGSQTKKARKVVVKNMAIYRENADMINVGAYKRGASAEIDMAINMHSAIDEFLQQEEYDKAPYADTLARLAAVSGVDIPDEEAI
jgi:flagellum-specific ATP synthase